MNQCHNKKKVHVFIDRRLLDATGITHTGPDDAWQGPEKGVARPEAAHTESCSFAGNLFRVSRHIAVRTNVMTFKDRTAESRAVLVRRGRTVVGHDVPY